jgi:DNA transposition AAA+ family ATPase
VEEPLRKTITKERQDLKEKTMSLTPFGYKTWLQTMAQQGRMDALEELRRIKDKETGSQRPKHNYWD